MAARRTDNDTASGPPSRVDKVAVPGAARALAVFEIYARERRGLTKSEIARLLGLPESSTSDLLNTLRDLGYVSRTVTSRQFYPTGRLNDLLVGTPDGGLTTFAAEATSLVASETGETAVFAVRSGTRAEIVAASEGHHRLRYVVSAGDTVSLYATSVGKALLSCLPDHDRATLLDQITLEPLTPHTAQDVNEVEESLHEGTERGVFVAVDEGTVGVSSFAVAGSVGEIGIGVGIIGPTGRFATHRDELIAHLAKARASIFDR